MNVIKQDFNSAANSCTLDLSPIPLGETSRCLLSVDAYEVGQRSDKPGVDLISDALSFGRLWYREPNAVSNAIGEGRSNRIAEPKSDGSRRS